MPTVITPEALAAFSANTLDGRIGTAGRYWRDVAELCEGGLCPTKHFGKAADAVELVQKLSGKLTYTDPTLLITESSRKSVEGETSVTTSPFILEFVGVVSTSSQDRDGDILDPLGCEIDPLAPLLWQHIPEAPIGSFLGLVEKSANRVVGRFGIADTMLGRDTVRLIEAKALRISHGFEPREYEPLDGGRYLIKQYATFEVSCVSIPANVQAVILAYQHKAFESDLCKDWAGGIYKSATRTISLPSGKASCSCHTKSAAAVEETPPVEVVDEAPPAPAPAPALTLTKRGRVISSANESLIRNACDHIRAGMKSDDLPKPTATLLQGTLDALEAVLEQLLPAGMEMEEEEKSAAITHENVIEFAFGLEIPQLKKLSTALGGILDCAEAQHESTETLAAVQAFGL